MILMLDGRTFRMLQDLRRLRQWLRAVLSPR
jgi:hypothetical protein